MTDDSNELHALNAKQRRALLTKLLHKKQAEMRTCPLSFAQQRLWFVDQLEGGSTAYLVTKAFHIKGPLNSGALEQSLEALIKRHEALRTTFDFSKGEPVQKIAPSLPFSLPVVDWQGFSPEEHGTSRLSVDNTQKREMP